MISGEKMIPKIAWLSLLTLALETVASSSTTRPPAVKANFFLDEKTDLPQTQDLTKYPVWKIHEYQEAPSKHSKSFKDHEFPDQQYRYSRTIWPFTYFDSNPDDTSVTSPPPEADSNLFLDEETALPESVDLVEYPVWRILEYQETPSKDSESSKDQEFPNQQYRHSRSIWPFTNSDSNSDETSVTTPPPEAEANLVFDANTALPQSLDLTMYPIWKIHKYNGFNLVPLKLLSENIYQPNGMLNPSRFDSSPQNQEVQSSYQSGYESFANSKNSQVDTANQQGPYSPVNPVNSDTVPNEETPNVYPPEQTSYPEEVQTYQSGESQSSDYWNSNNRQDVQKQHIIYGPPAENYGPPQVPHASYGVPATGGQTFQGEAASLPRTSPSDNADLSFLNDLGGLASFLPEPQDTTESPARSFFSNLFPWNRGTAEAPVTTETPAGSSQTGGLLSYIFGQRQQTEQAQTSESSSSSATSSIGSALSSLFATKKPAEKPAVALPPTIYLPETRGSYVVVRVPTGTETGLPNFDTRVSNLPIQDAPAVPFRPDDIPLVSAPTLHTDYNYNLGQAVERKNNRHQIFAATDSQDRSNDQHFVPAPAETTHRVEVDAIAGNQQTKYQQNDINAAKHQVQSIKEYQVPQVQKILVPVTVVPNNENAAQMNVGQHFENSGSKTGSSITSGQMQGSTYNFVPSAAYQLHIGTKNDRQTHFNNQLSNQNIKYVISNQDYKQFSNKPLTHVTSDVPVVTNNNRRFNDRVNNQQSTVSQVTTQGLREQTQLPNYRQQLPKVDKPFGPVSPTYQVSHSAYQSPRNPPRPTVHYDNLPVHEAVDFQKGSSHQETNNRTASAKQDFSSLTSYGTPTTSYQAGTFVASPSDVSEVIVEATNNVKAANDSISAEQQDQRKVTLSDNDDDREEVDAKVNEESSILHGNLRDKQVWRRSEPERQAPTDKQESSIYRSATDLIPDARVGRHFNEAKVILGYSQVQRNLATVQ